MSRSASPALFAGIALALALAVAVFANADSAYALAAGGEPVAVERVISGEESRDDPEANLPFLFAVFIITWAAFFAYLFITARRQREMQREIEALKAVLAEREADGPDDTGEREG